MRLANGRNVSLIPARLNIFRRLPVVLTQVVNSFYATNNLVDWSFDRPPCCRTPCLEPPVTAVPLHQRFDCSVTHALIITLCILVALSTSRHFGTGPELSWDTSGPVPKCPDTSGPVIWYRSVLVPKCPGTEVSCIPSDDPNPGFNIMAIFGANGPICDIKFVKHIEWQHDSGTGQQGTHNRLIVGLHKADHNW